MFLRLSRFLPGDNYSISETTIKYLEVVLDNLSELLSLNDSAFRSSLLENERLQKFMKTYFNDRRRPLDRSSISKFGTSAPETILDTERLLVEIDQRVVLVYLRCIVDASKSATKSQVEKVNATIPVMVHVTDLLCLSAIAGDSNIELIKCIVQMTFGVYSSPPDTSLQRQPIDSLGECLVMVNEASAFVAEFLGNVNADKLEGNTNIR